MKDQTSTELAFIVADTGLEKETANMIVARFVQFMEQIAEWETKAKTLVVTDVAQIEEMRQAREARLILKNIRVDADKVRKELKEDSLRYGRAVQSVYNAIESRISPIEDHLMNQEKFAEIQESKRLNALRTTRQEELSEYREYVPLSLDLATLTDEEYTKFRDMVHLQHQEAMQRIADAEQTRREIAEAAEKERQRLAAENAALIEKQKKIMAAQREAARIAEEKLKAEREKAEALRREAVREAEEKIAAEKKAARIEREKAEALLREEAARLAKLRAEEAARKRAEAKAARAPDAAKLQALANEIDAMVVPSMKSEEMQRIADNTRTLLTKTAVYIRQTLETIEKQ
jgi:hypothetical protein